MTAAQARAQREAEELAFRERRRLTLGASDAAPALGLSRFKTPLQLYREKIGEVEGPAETIPMRLGKEFEDYVLELFEDESGLTVSGQQSVITDPQFPWRTATQDGWVESELAQVEAKTTSAEQLYGDGHDEVPPDVMLQVQHQMAANPKAVMSFVPVLFLVSKRFRCYTISRNDEMIELLTQQEREFWGRVERRDPPPPTTEGDVMSLFPQDNAQTIIAPLPIETLCVDLASRNRELKAMKEEADKLKGRILAYLGESANLKSETGEMLCTYRTSSPAKRLDGKALKAAHPGIHAEFLRETPGSRRFLLKVK